MLRRKYTSILLLAAMVAMLTACPSEDDLTRMAKASRELAHDTVTAEQGVAALYQSGKLSLEVKDRAATKLKLVATNGQRFNNLVVELDKKYPQGTKPPESTLQLLRDNWQSVITPFQELYNDLKSEQAEGAAKDLKKNTDKITEVLEK